MTVIITPLVPPPTERDSTPNNGILASSPVAVEARAAQLAVGGLPCALARVSGIGYLQTA
jgi:hypothetical protein